MARKGGTVGLFLAGLMVLILLILSGILSALLSLPLYIIAMVAKMPSLTLISVVGAFIIGIIVLGWTFTRFKVRRR